MLTAVDSPTQIQTPDHLANAKALFTKQSYAEAAASCRAALAAGQKVPEALSLLGTIASLTKARQEALVLLRLALSLAPRDVPTLNAYAVALREVHRFAESREHLLRALSLAPNQPLVMRNLAHTYYNEKNFAEAAKYFALIDGKFPFEAKDYLARGWSLWKLKRHAEARAVFEAFARVAPNSADAWYGLANALYEMGKPNEAINAYRQAIKANPSALPSYINLGSLFIRHGNRGASVRVSREGLRVNAKASQLYMNLGVALGAGGMAREAVEAFRRTEDLENGNNKAASNRLFYMQYLDECTPRNLFEAHREWNMRYAAKAKRLPPRRPVPATGRKLRIGYVSPDLRSHSCAWFLQSLYDHHDHERFEVFSYSNADWSDRVTEDFKRRSDAWCDIQDWSPDDIAARVAKDEVDVLVDLAGHTARHSLLAFARKPAPVQATWLGYGTTTGLDTIDYRISDRWLTPGDTQEIFSEKVYNLDRLSHCFHPAPDAPAVGPLPADANGHVTFGSFNNYAKLSESTAELWARVLDAVPAARLLLKSRYMEDEEAHQSLVRRFEKAGMDLSRVDFTTGTASKLDHLAVYNRVDIGLDSFPYGGMTTTCEALWMGVPVLSRVGWRGCSRYGLSLMSAMDLPEYAADTVDGVVAAAVRAAGDIDRLRTIRAGLRQHMAGSDLCDAAGFTRAMERAYLDMWERCCASWRDETPR